MLMDTVTPHVGQERQSTPYRGACANRLILGVTDGIRTRNNRNHNASKIHLDAYPNPTESSFFLCHHGSVCSRSLPITPEHYRFLTTFCLPRACPCRDVLSLKIRNSLRLFWLNTRNALRLL